MNGSDYDIESVELDEPLGEGGSTKQTFTETMRDVWKYKFVYIGFNSKINHFYRGSYQYICGTIQMI